jgi:transposase
VALYDAGQPMAAVAQALGCCVGTVSNDLARWRTGGFAGLEAKAVGGSKPKLSEVQLQALEKALGAPPAEAGYQAGSWTLSLMVRFLVEQVGAPKVHLGSIGRRLMARGWRLLRPRLGIVRRDPKRQEKLAAIEQAKRGHWRWTRTP